MSSELKAPPDCERIALILLFIQPDWRRRDDDNLIASFKSGRDGLADALGINDRRFVTHASISTQKHKGGMIMVTLADEASYGAVELA